MEKVQISQDALYQFLTEHNMTIGLLAVKMGVSEGIVYGCFRHSLNRLGQPLKFSRANVEKLNQAISTIADELRQSVLTFGSDQKFTNQRGTTYDPALAEPIRHGISRYFNLKRMTERVLGWNKAKCEGTVCTKSSPMYGRVSQEDADRLNAELLSVAGVLSSYEVVTESDKDAQ